MAETTTQTYITKESDQLEAYKLGLLDQAKKISEVPFGRQDQTQKASRD